MNDILFFLGVEANWRVERGVVIGQRRGECSGLRAAILSRYSAVQRVSVDGRRTAAYCSVLWRT